MKIPGQGDTAGERNIFHHLFTQGADADRGDAVPQAISTVGIQPAVGELVTERFNITEDVFINDAYQSVEFVECVLQRG